MAGGRTPYATEIHDTPQKSVRIPYAGQPTFIVIHHAATESFRAVVNMELGGKQVSSTVIIKDGQVASMFDEFYRAWSLSSQYWDSVSLSSETCNSGGAAAGWPISNESYNTLAKVVADWCIRYGIPCNRERIMGHREVYTRYEASYATACPGGINLDLVVELANKIINGAPTPAPEIPKELGMAQRMYFARVDSTGNDNGEWMLAGVDMPKLDDKQDGYMVTTDKEVAKVWARQYSFRPTDTASVRLERDNYIKQQEFARADAQAWRENLRSILKD